MMRIGPRELLFLVVLSSVPVASWFFVFQPRNHDIAEARAEIVSMQMTLAQLNEVNQEVGDLGEAVSASEVRLARFRDNIPENTPVRVPADGCVQGAPADGRAQDAAEGV